MHVGDSASVLTICAGDPPAGPLSPYAESLHARWGIGREAVAQRRLEDITACQHISASARHLSIPDCIYRRSEDGVPLYDSENAIFGLLSPVEASLVQALGSQLERALAGGIRLVCPLALGGHVDHRLTRAAAEQSGQALWYYADYPYVLKEADHLNQLRLLGWDAVSFPVSERGMRAWVNAVAAHASQISTFWPDLDTMHAALAEYRAQNEGIRLWQPLSLR
jgi:LmbE family N-acetylglucosaminyl deacetylase